MTTQEKNEVIARWMGWETRNHEHLGLLYSLPENLVKAKRPSWVVSASMKFHSSWDWLMPVVDKIKQCYNDENDATKSIPMLEQTIFKCGIMSPKQVVFEAAFKFIEWYNANVKEK